MIGRQHRMAHLAQRAFWPNYLLPRFHPVSQLVHSQRVPAWEHCRSIGAESNVKLRISSCSFQACDDRGRHRAAGHELYEFQSLQSTVWV
jgi:hypothetical protein